MKACRSIVLALAVFAVVTACKPQKHPRPAAEVRAEIVRLLPAKTRDRSGWANDIQAAFAALEIEPSTENLCATLAVTEQESTFNTDPAVLGLGKIALAEIDRRAASHDIPQFLVHAALGFNSPNGKPYGERLASVRTEQDLSRIYEEFVDSVPLGKRLLAGSNPVHTAGPMQVSIAFAEQHAKSRPYPYAGQDTIRHEVFTRRGGMYFGIAHLLGYEASYPKLLYRFADYNAGFHASRNAAFQKAVSLVSDTDIPLDGDLVGYTRKGKAPGATEAATLSIATRLEMTPAQIHRDLRLGASAKFERSPLYLAVFDLAEQLQHRELPRAIVPRITLKSPKITRRLTTEWFADRVDQRYRRCLAKASGS